MKFLKRHFLAMLIIASVFYACKTSKGHKNEWRSLFNGKDLTGWVAKFHHHELGDNCANSFSENNVAIQVNYEGYTSFDRRY